VEGGEQRKKFMGNNTEMYRGGAVGKARGIYCKVLRFYSGQKLGEKQGRG
jgi:hypothetical protein